MSLQIHRSSCSWTQYYPILSFLISGHLYADYAHLSQGDPTSWFHPQSNFFLSQPKHFCCWNYSRPSHIRPSFIRRLGLSGWLKKIDFGKGRQYKNLRMQFELKIRLRKWLKLLVLCKILLRTYYYSLIDFYLRSIDKINARSY